MRVLNNRHWISDVLSGAGIGMVSTELAYALSDVIFKDKGLLRNNIDSVTNIVNHPSFFAISMGMGWGSKHIDFHVEDEDKAHDFNLQFRTSTMVSVEGAYFINKYLGFGGRLRVNTSPIDGWDRVLDYAQSDLKSVLKFFDDDTDLSNLNGIILNDADHKPEYTIESDHLTEFAYDLGVYGNLPLSKRFALGAKILGGRSIMQELNLKAHYQGEKKEFDIDMSDPEDPSFVITNALDANGNKQLYDTSWDYFVLDANNTWKLGTGISITYAHKNNFSFRLFADYDFTRKTYTLEYNPSEFLKDAMPELYEYATEEEDLSDFLIERQTLKKARHTFILGASFAVSF